MEKQSKISRILDIYDRLRAGRIIRKADEAERFGVDERSIQRDIDDIRAFLAEQDAQRGGRREIVYDRKRKGFLLAGQSSPLMTNSEILAVSKILLDSRAFPKGEMSAILDKLISGCVPQKNRKLVSDLIANEKFHYMELSHPADIQDKLWDLGLDIQRRQLLRLTYRRQGDGAAPVERVVEPVSILFSEYYFYLNAYIVEKDSAGVWTHRYDYPAVFRVDRVESYELLEQRFSLPYADRFQEGEFRKRVQFMYPGRLQSVRLRYTGPSVDAVLDRLPTARVLSQSRDSWTLEAEVYGTGVLMWLLSQGDRVEVLSPRSLRQELREALRRILEKYPEES